MAIHSYPEDFHVNPRALSTPCTNSEINKWIQEAVARLETDTNETFTYTMSGDSIVLVIRDFESEGYMIVVSKDYGIGWADFEEGPH